MSFFHFTIVLSSFAVLSLSAILNLSHIELDALDIAEYRLIKSSMELRASRKVYTDERLIYKIWDRGFWRSDHFLRAIKCGFYDENNTSLQGVIWHQGVCRGYVARLIKGGRPYLEIRNGIISPLSEQKSEEYIDFYNDLLDRTLKFGLVYLDLTCTNLILDVDDNKVKIMDLEPVVPFLLVNGSFFRDRAYPIEYRDHIKRLKS